MTRLFKMIGLSSVTLAMPWCVEIHGMSIIPNDLLTAWLPF